MEKENIEGENSWSVVGGGIDVEPQGKKIGSVIEPESVAVVISGSQEEVPCFETFVAMNLKENLLRGIYGYGFEIPSKIQQRCIPIMSKKKDLIAQSQAGTGKTGAFTCGILQVINENENYPQSIIMAPTHELSSQINSVITDIGKYMKVRTALCIGGNSVEANIKDARGSHIIIGTPGRINDLIQRGAINVKRIVVFVLDEADVLLSHEFIHQTRNIIEKLPEQSQMCIFSATLSHETIMVTNKFMNKPVNILVQQDKLSLDSIIQYYIDVGQDKFKLDVLEDIYSKFSIGQCIIYVNHKDKAVWLKEKLNELGHAVEAIHGSLTPVERTMVMKQFRSGNYRVLISTDLLARGIDVQQVGYVVNYDLPHDTESYLHRIGRSGRYGKKGVAINFVTRRDMYQLKNIMNKYKINIESMPDPQYLNDYLMGKN
ncbi:MAG: translation initiation factor 4A-III [Hyperionvirus sp.]|uniref:RNA helicase n=1 Tax=Hyperionvirus sp. TaxID=2487770 RepID=A0A3G5AAG5_9VIRU|nr:MAG: translation initiation factor 4A-III [Hyperionvirus sp.]